MGERVSRRKFLVGGVLAALTVNSLLPSSERRYTSEQSLAFQALDAAKGRFTQGDGLIEKVLVLGNPSFRATLDVGAPENPVRTFADTQTSIAQITWQDGQAATRIVFTPNMVYTTSTDQSGHTISTPGISVSEFALRNVMNTIATGRELPQVEQTAMQDGISTEQTALENRLREGTHVQPISFQREPASYDQSTLPNLFQQLLPA